MFGFQSGDIGGLRLEDAEIIDPQGSRGAISAMMVRRWNSRSLTKDLRRGQMTKLRDLVFLASIAARARRERVGKGCSLAAAV